MMKKLRIIPFIFIVLLGFGLSAQNIFINEIHYDNSGGDVDEGIEVAGPAGTDLDGYSLALYNGSNGSLYNTINLSGTIGNQLAGMGTLFFGLPVNGLQNGAPDGLALVDNTAAVLQFVSYEGSFTASGGPADGITSIDIGVSESSGNAIGNSLQLSGIGYMYSDFTWEAPAANTYGAVNNGQTFSSPNVSAVINEFVLNHTGSDSEEFIEILGAPNADLSNYNVLAIEGDGSAAGTIDTILNLGTTDGAGYFTTSFGANVFENGTLSLLLIEDFSGNAGDDLDTDNDGILDNTPWVELVDAVAVNDGGTSDLNYGGTVLEQGFDGISFTVGGASRIPNGTDTDNANDWVRNDFDGAGLPGFPAAVADAGEAINTPGAANEVAQGPAVTLIINELDADNTGTDTMEFVELYDGGAGNSSLDGYILVFYNGSNDQSYSTYDLNGFTTNASGYFVLGNAAVPNVDIIFGSNGLQNGADAVALYLDEAANFPTGTPISTGNLIDAVVYDTNDADDDALLILLNAGQPQLNEGGAGNKDIHSLQRFPNGSGGQRNTDSYVQAIPTPGTANSSFTEPITVLINEIDADTAGTDTREFVELFDGGSGNTSLDGLVLVFYNGSNDSSYSAWDLDGFSTNSEGYFVLGNSAVSNVSIVFPNNGLQNGADAVALYVGSDADFPDGTAVTNTNIIDAVVYDTNDSDDSGLLILLNNGQSQLNEDQLGDKDSHSLQRIPNGQGGVRNTDNYVTELPTPGIENGGTVGPVEPITIAEARAATEGEQVKISGVLTVSDNFAGPAYLQDTTGGIAVFDESVHGDLLFAVGDSLTITGIRSSFNMQVQLGPVTDVESHGSAAQPPIPVDVSLNQLSDYAGQLVRITDPDFPNPGDLLFGNSNYNLTDTSGSGQMRIDNDVADIVGLAQPESCNEVIGVIGRFNDNFQLLPRVRTDISCAPVYEPIDGIDVDKEKTFDLVTWNIEWFGDEGNSPPAGDANSDEIQKESVKAVLQELNSDVYVVQEIADDALFSSLVNEMDGYDYILSEAVSRPNEPGVKQKIGFIYNTATVTPLQTRALFTSVHPLYNGGDASALADYPDAPDRFFASGRLPFLMEAKVTIEGETQLINMVALHARANSSNGPQTRYDMRRYDVELLKDSLDVMYPDKNVMILGDFNDDVDETVADIDSTESSYIQYVDDNVNYEVLTAGLSEAGFRSFVFRENMIDHLMATDELFENYIDESARVHYEFYNNQYSNTTSDHLPVSVRMQLKTLELLNPLVTHVSCNGFADGSIQAVVTGGIEPYTYEWSTGATGEVLENLAAGIYLLTVTDALGAQMSQEIEVTEPDALELTVSETQTVYPGYEPQACATVSVESIVGGTPDYHYEWNNGETTAEITVCPEVDTIYTVTVTDANGCTVIGEVSVIAIDVFCNRSSRPGALRPGVQICFRGREICVREASVPYYLNKGAVLGSCESDDDGADESTFEIKSVFPNPFHSEINLQAFTDKSRSVDLQILSLRGQIVFEENFVLQNGTNNLLVSNLNFLPQGIYILKLSGNGIPQETFKILKRNR